MRKYEGRGLPCRQAGTRDEGRRPVKLLLALVFIIISSFFTDLAHARTGPASLASTERLFLEGKYDRAILEADKLIDSRASGREELYYLKALSQLGIGDFRPSRESFNTLIEKYPRGKRTVDAYIGIGDSYFLEKNMDQALKSYEDVLSRYPNDRNIALVYHKIAACYQNMGLNDKAHSYFSKVSKEAPLSFEARMPSSGMKENMGVTRAVHPGTAVSSSATPGSFMSVQVGSFKSKSNAERLVARLSRAGYASYIEIPTGSSNAFYRVKVGRYATSDEAKKAAAQLKKAGYKTKICTTSICE